MPSHCDGGMSVKKPYRVIDAHCDTMTELAQKGGTLMHNNMHLDVKRMRDYAAYLQFFAVWVDDSSQAPFADCMAVLRLYRHEMERTPMLSPVLTAADVRNVMQKGMVGAMLTVENGVVLEGHAERLQQLWDCGVRAMTITWNGQNELCTGSMADGEGGLTPFGREVLSEMNRLGMLIDVSHASEQGFWDILKSSRCPVFASHSNSCSVCAHPRNLKDEQIRAIAEQGGVIGLNLYPLFLSGQTAELSDCIRHIRHIMQIGGEACIGLGSDFDGVERLPWGMQGVEDYDKLFMLMEQFGFTSGQIERITYKNFMEYLIQVFK